MTTAIYTRQSLDRTGQAAGVDRQEVECRALAERKGITVGRTLSDNDVSATTGVARPGFEQLLDLVEAGIVDTVVVWHTDRLYRRTRDLERIIDAAERGLRIVTVQAGDFDLNSPSGRLFARNLANVATFEGEHRTARQKAAYRDRAARGEWGFTHRPFGYRRDGRDIVQVPDEAATLREVLHRYYEEAVPRYSIMKDLNARGILTPRGKPWGIIQVRDLLTNPAYGGVVRYLDETFDVAPKWEPIVDRDTWGRWMSAGAKRKRRSTFTSAAYLLSGILVCGHCNGKVYATRAEAGGVPSYRCRDKACAQRLVAPVDAFVEELVRRRLARPDALAIMRPTTPNADALLDELSSIRGRLDDLAGLLADGTLAAQAVRDAAAPLHRRAEELRARLAASTKLDDLPTVEDARARWDDLALPQRRAVVRVLFAELRLIRIPGRTFHPDAIQVDWAIS
jgi:site-specific DNA recombinase